MTEQLERERLVESSRTTLMASSRALAASLAAVSVRVAASAAGTLSPAASTVFRVSPGDAGSVTAKCYWKQGTTRGVSNERSQHEAPWPMIEFHRKKTFDGVVIYVQPSAG
jgi:hypothetical protein